MTNRRVCVHSVAVAEELVELEFLNAPPPPASSDELADDLRSVHGELRGMRSQIGDVRLQIEKMQIEMRRAGAVGRTGAPPAPEHADGLDDPLSDDDTFAGQSTTPRRASTTALFPSLWASFSRPAARAGLTIAPHAGAPPSPEFADGRGDRGGRPWSASAIRGRSAFNDARPARQGHDGATIGATPFAELRAEANDDFDRAAARRPPDGLRAQVDELRAELEGLRSTVLSGQDRAGQGSPTAWSATHASIPATPTGAATRARPGSAPPARRLGGWGKSSPAVHPGLAHEPPTSPMPSPTHGSAVEALQAKVRALEQHLAGRLVEYGPYARGHMPGFAGVAKPEPPDTDAKRLLAEMERAETNRKALVRLVNREGVKTRGRLGVLEAGLNDAGARADVDALRSEADALRAALGESDGRAAALRAEHDALVASIAARDAPRLPFSAVDCAAAREDILDEINAQLAVMTHARAVAFADPTSLLLVETARIGYALAIAIERVEASAAALACDSVFREAIDRARESVARAREPFAEKISERIREANARAEAEENAKIKAGVYDTPENQAALHHAAKRNETKRATALIKLGVDVDAPLPETETLRLQTPLLIAAFNGGLEVVNVLLSAGATVNKPPDAGSASVEATPLHCASANGHLDVVKALLVAGADTSVASDPANERAIDVVCARFENEHNKTAIEALLRGDPPEEDMLRAELEALTVRVEALEALG